MVQPDAPQASSSSSGPRRGIRQRQGLASSSAQSDDTPRRGVRQRVEKSLSMDPTDTPQPDLPFNKLMRKKWGSGDFSAPLVKEVSRAAQGQGAHSVGRFAGSGGSDYAKNAHRDLLAAVGYPQNAPPITWLEIEMADGSYLSHPIVSPIDTIETLLKNDHMFISHLRGAEGDSAAFIEGIKEHPIFESIAAHVTDANKSLICGLHGDGAPTTKVEGLFTLSWNSYHVSGNSSQTRNVYTVIRTTSMDAEKRILNAVLERLVWEFDCLALGHIKSVDYQGRVHPKGGSSIANGWKMFLLFCRGDWEYFVKVFEFPSWNSVPYCCFVCSASPTIAELIFSRSGPTAGWRATIKTHASYVAELAAAGKPIPILLRSLTLRLEGIMIDPMHTIDQGIAPHLLANVFLEIMELGHWGPNQAEQLVGLAAALKAWEKKTLHVYRLQGKLSWSRIRTSGDWPKLKAKAANCRHLLRFAFELCTTYSSGSVHDHRRMACCQLLCRFYEIINLEGRFLSAAAKTEIAAIGPLFLQLYSHLSAEALESRKRAWKLVPKFHMFVHLCELQTFINPRWSWCYADEDLQKFMKKIALACHPLNLAPMVIFKWLIRKYDDDEC